MRQTLCVAESAEGPALFGNPVLQQSPDFFHQAFGKHVVRPFVDAGVEGIARRVKPEQEHTVAFQAFAAVPPLLADGPLAEQRNFDCPNDLWRIVGMDCSGGPPIKPCQHPPQMACAVLGF